MYLTNKKKVHSAQHPSISATSRLLRMCGRQLTLFSYFERKLPYMKQKRNMNSISWLERNDLFSFGKYTHMHHTKAHFSFLVMKV